MRPSGFRFFFFFLFLFSGAQNLIFWASIAAPFLETFLKKIIRLSRLGVFFFLSMFFFPKILSFFVFFFFFEFFDFLFVEFYSFSFFFF